MRGVLTFGLSLAPRLVPLSRFAPRDGGVQTRAQRVRVAPRRLGFATMSADTRHKAAMDDVQDGAFKRKESVFRSALSADGSTPFAPEPNRYRLYISLACPWASRCFMMLSMQGLLEAVPLTVVHHFMSSDAGWTFVTADTRDPPPMCEPEPLYGFKSIRELYFKADPDYSGRFTVPVLWDTRTETIVNNESSELIVMLNQFAVELGASPARAVDLYPAAMRAEVDKVAQSFYNGSVTRRARPRAIRRAACRSLEFCALTRPLRPLQA
jgi:glutathionyl-hydroquinone reductase